MSEMGDPEKSVEMFHSAEDIICFYPDQTDIEGNDKKQDPDDERPESVHSSEEGVSTKQISNHSDDIRRSTECENEAFECSDEGEIYKLWLRYEWVSGY